MNPPSASNPDAAPQERGRLLRLATRASVSVASLLIVVKLFAWVRTDSVAVLASLMDSMMDVGASLVNLLAVRYALMPPDREHRFGHGKAESLAGLGQATFIAGSALFLGFHAIDRMRNPRPPEDLLVGISVMVFAIVATLALVMLQRYVIARTGSTAIKADALHYITDLATNVSIIGALLLASFGLPWMDPLFAMGIAVYILYSSVQIGHEAVQALLDRDLGDDVRGQVLALAKAQRGVLGVHDLRTRESGHTWFIQLHLELDGRRSLADAHDTAEEVRLAIESTFPRAEVIIHQDPV